MTKPAAPQRPQVFAGFEPLDANFLYCPNQFFDVCLPHGSRGVVRLVAYLLRRTLGWLDKQGQPIEQDIAVAYRELIEEAHISRGAIATAMHEAIDAGFIERLSSGRPDARGRPAESSQFRLRWAETGDYTRSLDDFAGFFTGEGHRTPIPNAFFDQVVHREPLSVVKVVGTVLRHTVGYQNQFGGRRESAPLSYSYIQQYSQLSDRTTLSSALRAALDAGYIECVREGVFSPDSSARSAAHYAPRWLQPATDSTTGSKIRPATLKQSKNPTSRKTVLKDTDKQQAAAVDFKAIEMLRAAGFDESMARQLAAKRGVEEVQRQIECLELRNPNRNRLGMLRKAIEENWPSPVDEQTTNKTVRRRQRPQATDEIEQNTEQAAQRRSERERQLRHWKELDEREKRRLHRLAIDSAKSAIVRHRLHSHVDLEHPPTETLRLLDATDTSQ